MSSSEENCDSFWIILDTAFDSLYSSTEENQRENILNHIESCIINVKDWSFLTDVNSTSFFTWLVQNFSRILTDDSFSQFHERITSTCVVLVNTLTSKPALLTTVIKTFLQITKSFLYYQNEIANGVLLKITLFSYTNIPFGIKNTFPSIPVKQNTVISSLVNCFCEMCCYNHELISDHASLFTSDIIDLFIGLMKLVKPDEICGLSKIVVLLASKTVSSLPVKGLSTVCMQFNSLESDKGLLDGFVLLLQKFLSMKIYSRTHSLLWISLLKCIDSKSINSTEDIYKLVCLGKSYIEMIPAEELLQLNILNFPTHAQSKQVYYEILGAYFLKSFENYINGIVALNQSALTMSKAFASWSEMLFYVNVNIKRILTSNEDWGDYLNDVNTFFSMANVLKNLENKYNCKIFIYDSICNHVFDIFSSIKIENIIEEDMHGIFKLCANSIQILEECNPNHVKYFMTICEFLLTPLIDKNKDFPQDWLKAFCYDSLINFLHCVMNIPEISNIAVKLADVLFEIASCDVAFLDKCFFSLVICLLSDNMGREKYFSALIKTFLIKDRIQILIKSSTVRDLLPCFISSCCVLNRGRAGIEIRCSYCDKKDLCRSQLKDVDLGHYTSFIGFSFMNTLFGLDIEPSEKLQLLKSLKRFVFHVPILKSEEFILNVSELIIETCLSLNLQFLSTLKPFVLDYNQNLILENARIIVQKTIFVLFEKYNIDNTQHLGKFLDFLLYISYSSKEFILLFVKVLFLIVFENLQNPIERILLKKKLNSLLKIYEMDAVDLLIIHEKELSEFWIDMISKNISKETCDTEDTLTYIGEIFNMRPRSFLEFRSTPYMVAYILTVCTNEEADCIIGDLSDILLTTMKELVLNCFVIVFSVIYFMDDEAVVTQALNYVEVVSQKGLDALIYYFFKDLVCFVIMNSDKPLKVTRFFQCFVYKQKESNVYKSIGDILLQYTEGFLTFVDAKLSSKSSSFYIIKSCLISIPNLIQILGRANLAKIRIKLLATLRTGLPLHYKSHPLECLEAWAYFLYSINLSFLGPYLPTIVTLLLPFFTTFPMDVCKILDYLVMRKGNLYEDYLPELFFLQDLSNPLLTDVCKKIKTIRKRTDIIDGLSTTLEHIKNGAVESRIHCFEFLHHQLKLRKYEVLRIINLTDNLPILIHQIIDCLMMNIHYGNLELRTICARCLGEIGAINPASFNYSFQPEGPRKFVDVESEEFCLLIITELTKSLQKSQDSFSYNIIANSIQEIFKLYFPNIQPEKVEASFLSKFSTNDANILKTLLGSKYVSIIHTIQEPVIMGKKHGSNKNQSIFEWARLWASELVALMPLDSFVRQVFKNCLPGIQSDSETMEALLPYILLQTILSCSKKDADFIASEMKYILDFKEQNRLIEPYPIEFHRISAKNKPCIGSFELSVTDEQGVAVILDLIDFLFKYFSHIKITKETGLHLNRMSEFLKKFPANFISLKSYTLQDYCRALFYLERNYSSLATPHNLSPLKNIYAKLNDADGLLGIIRTSNNIPTIEESMLNHVVCGNVQEALPAYELLAAKHKKSTECYRALIQCYLSINSPFVAANISHSFFNISEECIRTSFGCELVECAWKNLMFDDLKSITAHFDGKMKKNWSWSVDIGLAYLDFFTLDFNAMNSKIHLILQTISERIAAISSTTIGAYRQGYSHIINLHILNELEMFAELVREIQEPYTHLRLPKLIEKMNLGSRLQLLPSNSSFVEKVMSSRIQVLSMINILDQIPNGVKSVLNYELGVAYLKSAQIARKNSNFQLSSTFLALAENFEPPGLFIEKAKLYEAKHEIDSAIYILKQGIMQGDQPSNQLLDAKLSAHAKLLIARYNEQNMNVDYNEGTRSYRDAINTYPTEKNYLHLAQYLYKIHSAESSPDRTANKCEVQVQAIKNFGKSLLYGCKYIYQSMFCMISLWLDFGSRFKKVVDSMKIQKHTPPKFQEEAMNQMDTLMEEFFQEHPTYMYMAVFSQLLSRINHPYTKCQQALIEIISKVAVDYPQQAFWMMIPLWKTEDAVLNRMGSMILLKMRQVEKSISSVTKFYSIFNDLVDILINICNKKIPPGKTVVPLKNISQKLKVLLKSNPNRIMIPAQKFRTISLPKAKHFSSAEIKLMHNPYPLTLSYFVDVDEDVQVLVSQARPRKLVFRGSDGMAYPFMCKPLDDLMLDSRTMEFCSVVNMYLQRDPTSCDRNLHIKTYSAVPINPTTGLIEWLPNLAGYRNVLIKMYKMKSYKLPSSSEIKNKIEACKTVEQKLKLFNEVLLPQHPPVLHKWFFHQFSSPDSWYLARKSFVRTAAVMSIVGYVVGLGDRHGENILLDTINGDLIHVDFNCVFGKGEHFAVPELVPFRLTQNMVKAMGSTGIEGHFMRSCEITNRVIRSHSDQLLYVLKPFLYDPKLQNNSSAVDRAQNNINTINKKMTGFVITPKRKTQALSVEGQVRCLISEATSHENLCQMFIGWNAFL